MSAATLVMSPLAHLATHLKRTASFKETTLATRDFVALSETLLPFFSHLGPVFSFAEGEFAAKLQTLRDASGRYGTLAEMVAADQAAGRAAIKNSSTRNLHRLMSAVMFIKILLERLMAAPTAPLREAASEAYEAALAPFHTGLIRGVVRASLLTLPSREHFLAAVGETEATIGPRCEDVVASCTAVVAAVSKLLSGIDFPVSDVWFWPSR